MLCLIVILCVPFAIALNITSFPPNFQFGVATSAYQIEGAWNVSGKSESIWDRAMHLNASLITDHQNGDVACDSYHKIKEDVSMLKLLKVNGYRFSLSWCRLFPSGYATKSNPDGLRYYNELINELVANNIQPWVTIYHWDLPQSLQDIGGWANPVLADIYLEYADKVFGLFGDRVKLWYTLNEPGNHCQKSYTGRDAPFLPDDGVGIYKCVHNVLRAHAKAYRLYDRKYRKLQRGRITIVIDSSWPVPRNDSSPEDHLAAESYRQMFLGWTAHPIFSEMGDYPPMMRTRIDMLSKIQGLPTSRLPIFTEAEIREIRGSADFLAINTYSAQTVSFANMPVSLTPSSFNDMNITSGHDPKWEGTGMPVFFMTPSGLYQILKWLTKEYGSGLEISVTENGYAGFRNDSVNDYKRIEYLNIYLKEVLHAISDGCNVTSYIVWTLMNDIEWTNGYTIPFGLFHVDFTDPNRTRRPKASAFIYRNIIETRHIDEHYFPAEHIHRNNNIAHKSTQILYLTVICLIIFILCL